MNQQYLDTVALLLEVAPQIFRSESFAIKGGTALNFFVQEMPRLSVDIDLVYLDYDRERNAALASIAEELTGIQQRLAKLGFEVSIQRTKLGEDLKLLVGNTQSLVKIEVNHVFRGTLLPVETRRLTANARELFKNDFSVPILAEPELYGSKLVAAFDRQHPRDLYDVLWMYERSGLTDAIVECFVSYLAGHNRPIHEVLFSNDNDMTPAYEKEFAGMTNVSVSLAKLVETRQRLRRELPNALSSEQRQFLLSLAKGTPDWSLMACPHLQELPALRWKVLNLAKLKKMNAIKFRQQSEELESRFTRLDH